MKKILAMLVCIAMLLSMALTLVSCGGDGTEEGEGTGDVGGGDKPAPAPTPDPTPDPEPEPEPLPPYSVVEKYFPAAVRSNLEANFAEKATTNGYKELSKTAGPFAYTDIETVTNGKLKSITIPVMKTSKAKACVVDKVTYEEIPDADPENIDTETQMLIYEHKFTIYKIGSSATGIVEDPIETYEIIIDPYAFDLPVVARTSLYTIITVDVSEYNIVLGEGETLAFVSSTDTITAAYLQISETVNYPMSNVFKSMFPQTSAAFTGVGKGGSLKYARDINLCFDLEFERTYENVNVYNSMLAEEAAYQATIAALKALYQGKKISIVGDSISTYAGVSNDKTANATTEKHDLYYPSKDWSFYSYEYTYWGRTIKDLGMSLCVNNSWSGARTYGGFRTATDYNDRLPFRANELDRDDGTKPDVILVYLGINDVLNAKDVPMGDLYEILTNENDSRTDNEKVAEWFQGVLANAGKAPYKPMVDGATTGYTTFDQAYALGIYTMLQNYPAAEIYCLTLLFNYHSGFTAERLEMANRAIIAIANYFGATVVDQNGEYSGLNQDNIHAYGSFVTSTTSDCVHLTSRGHEIMERTIIMTMAKKNGLI